jgi:hypothetical protein
MNNLYALIAQTGGLECSLDFFLLSDQEKRGYFLICFQRASDALDDDPTTMVATHDIDYDSHKWKEGGTEVPNPAISSMDQDPAVTLMTWRPL